MWNTPPHRSTYDLDFECHRPPTTPVQNQVSKHMLFDISNRKSLLSNMKARFQIFHLKDFENVTHTEVSDGPVVRTNSE